MKGKKLENALQTLNQPFHWQGEPHYHKAIQQTHMIRKFLHLHWPNNFSSQGPAGPEKKPRFGIGSLTHGREFYLSLHSMALWKRSIAVGDGAHLKAPICKAQVHFKDQLPIFSWAIVLHTERFWNQHDFLGRHCNSCLNRFDKTFHRAHLLKASGDKLECGKILKVPILRWAIDLWGTFNPSARE